MLVERSYIALCFPTVCDLDEFFRVAFLARIYCVEEIEDRRPQPPNAQTGSGKQQKNIPPLA